MERVSEKAWLLAALTVVAALIVVGMEVVVQLRAKPAAAETTEKPRKVEPVVVEPVDPLAIARRGGPLQVLIQRAMTEPGRLEDVVSPRFTPEELEALRVSKVDLQFDRMETVRRTSKVVLLEAPWVPFEGDEKIGRFRFVKRAEGWRLDAYEMLEPEKRYRR